MPSDGVVGPPPEQTSGGDPEEPFTCPECGAPITRSGGWRYVDSLLQRNAAELARQRGRHSIAERLSLAAADAQKEALLLRELIIGQRGAAPVSPEGTDESVFDPDTN